MADRISRVVQLKGPTVPPPLTPPPQKIEFYHPCYGWPDALFSLPRLDSIDPRSPPGVHHGTALFACQIVANNAFRGYLAVDPMGQHRVTKGRDEILTENSYWFIADPQCPQDCYSIVPSFADWTFPDHVPFEETGWHRPPRPRRAPFPPRSPSPSPHDDLDPHYSTRNRCVVSNASYPLCHAYILPKSAEGWFSVNEMVELDEGIHAPENRLYLSHDLYSVWDKDKFAIVPKCNQWTVHLLDVPQQGREFAAQWHNTRVPIASRGRGLPDVYLLAKFAHAVFELINPFVTRIDGKRWVVTRHWVEGEMLTCRQYLPGDDLVKLYGRGTGSSGVNGRTKRTHSRTFGEDDDEGADRPGPAQDDGRRALSRDHLERLAGANGVQRASGTGPADWYSSRPPVLEPPLFHLPREQRHLRLPTPGGLMTPENMARHTPDRNIRDRDVLEQNVLRRNVEEEERKIQLRVANEPKPRNVGPHTPPQERVILPPIFDANIGVDDQRHAGANPQAQ